MTKTQYTLHKLLGKRTGRTKIIGAYPNTDEGRKHAERDLSTYNLAGVPVALYGPDGQRVTIKP